MTAKAAVTMYTTAWCGYCHRLRSQMEREGIPFDAIDIEHVADAAVLVAQINGGNLTVPTVVYPDGSAHTNPSVKQVREKLASLGHLA